MAKLCYKVNGTVKEYDLKDSVNGTPKLGVKVGGTTKYLGLKQGTKSGELQVKVNGQTYYAQRLKEPEDVTPQRAPWEFRIRHFEQDPLYGGVKTYSASNVAVPTYLGGASDTYPSGTSGYSSPQWAISEHEYMYLPSDNAKGTYADDNRGFIDTSQHSGWYMCYSHRHGRTIWIIAININGVEQKPNVSRRIHVGDKIAVRFYINHDYGNGSDNFHDWSYWCRPVLRCLDD